MPLECDLKVDRRVSHILGFAQDQEGHWFAQLSCGHTQHMRHQPPWQNRAWVQIATLREQQIGSRLICGWCQALQSVQTADKD